MCFLFSQELCGNIFFCFVHNSFTVYLITCMYAMRKFAVCECYCLFFTLCRCVVALLIWVSVVYFSLQMCCGPFCEIMFVSICYLFLLADKRWWVCYQLFVFLFLFAVMCWFFLCEYVLKCPLFISICRWDINNGQLITCSHKNHHRTSAKKLITYSNKMTNSPLKMEINNTQFIT